MFHRQAFANLIKIIGSLFIVNNILINLTQSFSPLIACLEGIENSCLALALGAYDLVCHGLTKCNVEWNGIIDFVPEFGVFGQSNCVLDRGDRFALEF